MTAPRTPLTAWRYPKDKILNEGAYAAGRPPFDPFPSIRSVVNAAFCPQASWHEFMNGDDGALLPRYGDPDPDDLFAGFVGHLKQEVSRGTVPLANKNPTVAGQVAIVAFSGYAGAHGYSTEAAQELWGHGIDRWVHRQAAAGEFQRLAAGDAVYSNVAVANPRMELPLGDGKRHYPLRGVVDEVDLKRRRLTVFSIHPAAAGRAPLMKDLSLWLAWRALCSLEEEQLPPEWAGTDFSAFELAVETPTEDITVERSERAYPESAHAAYAWIHDICAFDSPGVHAEVIDGARCGPENPDRECSHPFWGCFGRKMPFPTTRDQVRGTFKPWSRMLLWEKIWDDDLWWYQTLSLAEHKLLDRSLIWKGKIVAAAPDRVEIELDPRAGRIAGGFDKFELIHFGTMFCGQRRGATLLDADGGRLTMKVAGDPTSRSRRALILPAVGDSSSLLQREPHYLIEQQQRGLFKVHRMGVIKPDKAATVSQIQLMESVFGEKPLRGKRP